MAGRCFFTICAKNYLPIAHTCISSAKRFHPNAKFFLFLCDVPEEGYESYSEEYDVVVVSTLKIPNFRDMVFRYDVTELNTAVKPSCFMDLMGRGFDEILYIDPDLYVASAFSEVFEAFDRGVEAVLTPHICQPVEDGEKPDDLTMLQAGAYNLGFLALRNTKATAAFVAWWRERLETGCVADLARSLFVDQKWCDLLPSFVEKTLVLRHPGYNVAYWNLMQRTVAETGGAWTVNGEPLRFFHFSGASFSDAAVFSKHQSRFDASNIGEAGKLYDAYRAAVKANGLADFSKLSYRYNFSEDGKPIQLMLRELYREEVAPAESLTAGDPFVLAFEYASRSDPRWPDVPGLPLNRIMARLWGKRPDLQAAFNLDTFDGRLGFIHWYRHSTTQEMGWDPSFEAVVADAYNPVAGRAWFSMRDAIEPAPARPPSLWYRFTRIRSVRRIRKILRRWFGLERKPAATPTVTALPSAEPEVARARSSAAESIFAGLAPGALLIGYVRSELGMGEHVRMTAQAFKTVQAPFGVYNYSANVLARQNDHRYDDVLHEAPDFKANIFHINADQLPTVIGDLGQGFLIGRRNMVFQSWELAQFPEPWARALEAMDEVWAPSKFIQEAVSKSIAKPVVWMPLAVELAQGHEAVTRERFGIPQGRLAFVFTFDFASFISRKNPYGAVAAYLAAFPKPTADGPILVIKTISGERHPAELAKLRKMIGKRADIMLIDETVTAAEIHGLINCCDCYVSLHRSEGFGRGIAESMLMGKPVIATAYSGNMDFCTPENSLLVDYGLIALSEGDYPFWENQVWADPDIAQAAAYMKQVADDPDAAGAIGAKAREHLIAHHSGAATGERFVARLRETGCIP